MVTVSGSSTVFSAISAISTSTVDISTRYSEIDDTQFLTDGPIRVDGIGLIAQYDNYYDCYYEKNVHVFRENYATFALKVPSDLPINTFPVEVSGKPALNISFSVGTVAAELAVSEKYNAPAADMITIPTDTMKDGILTP